ncbi:MAG: tetratricopeptide repeat protein [Myxococcota bacterium]|nr:tetratricopeptide repeat protein [Myxococcota bacterium]
MLQSAAMHARLLDRLALLVPLAAGALVYANALGNSFVLDDYHFILENPVVRGEAPLGFLEVTTTPGGHFYRPLGLLSYRLDYLLAGPSPHWLHLASVLYHLLAVLLVVLLGRALLGRGAALVAGLLFAVHPVHVEAVTALANRTEVLATIGYLGAILAWLRLPRRGAGPAVLLCGLLALLCKESALTLPLALLLVDWLRPGGRLRPASLLWTLPAVAIYYGLRTLAFQDVGFTAYPDWFAGRPLGERVFGILDLLGRYARLLVVPTELCADWAPPRVPPVTEPTLGVVVGLLIGIGSALGFVQLARRRAPAALGLGLGLTGLVLYLHVIPLGVLMAERFLYLPSAGFALLAGSAAASLARRVARPWLVPALVGGVALAFGALTVDRNVDWENPLILWSVTAAHPQASALSHGNLGLAWFWAGKPDLARASLERAVQLEPGRQSFRHSLALLCREAGASPEEVRAVEEGRARTCLTRPPGPGR